MAIKKFNTVAGLSVGEDASIDVIDGLGNVTANNLTATGISDLGPISNVIITGGTDGQFLTTDGSGNLDWQTVDLTAINNGNSNVKIGSLDGNITMSVDGNANIITVTSIGANVDGDFDVNGNTTLNNLQVNGTLIAGDIAVSSIANGTSNVDIVGVSGNITISVNGNANVFTVTEGGVSVDGNISLNAGILANGSYGNRFDVLTSDGNGNVTWDGRYYYSNVMYDFTAYGMGWMTLFPNQDPVTLGFDPNISVPYGSIFILVTNDGVDDPLPITIYSPNSKTTPMMWLTIDGLGPYDPVTNPNGSDYWFNITPPA